MIPLLLITLRQHKQEKGCLLLKLQSRVFDITSDSDRLFAGIAALCSHSAPEFVLLDVEPAL